MSITTRHLIRGTAASGLAAGLCSALLLASPGQAAGGKTHTLRIFDRPVALTLTHADGSVVRRPPYPDPAPGDVLDVVSNDYVGTHVRHGRRPIGTTHLRCAFAAGGPPDCVSHVAIGSSMLVFAGSPGRVVLGTGRYLGATGRVVSSTEVGGNASDIVARIILR